MNQIYNPYRAFCTGDFKIRFKNKQEDYSENESELDEISFDNQDSIMKRQSNFMFDLPHDLDGTHALPKLPKRDKIEQFLESKII